MKKRIQTVAIALIQKGETYLLTKRQDDTDTEYNGMWQMPGGGQEFNETIAQCLVREVKEETGLTVKSHTLIPIIWEEIRKAWHGMFLCHLCTVEDENQEVILDAEASEFGWFTLDQIKSLNVIPGTVDVIVEAQKMGARERT